MHTTEQTQDIQKIHDLLADSRKEYTAAAKRVPDERVQRLLHSISIERDVLEEELTLDIRQHASSARIGDGTLGGTVHRALLIARDTINNTSEVNVLVEMERQEAELLGHYNKILQTQDLDEFTRATLSKQHAEIERNVKMIHGLRREMEAVEH